MITAEQAEKDAETLYLLANAIGESLETVKGLIFDKSAVMEEKEALDELFIHAPDTIHALRTLAMRLDRAVLIKTQKDE